jgi:hypothetical protein
MVYIILGLEITRFGPFVTPGSHLLQFNSKDNISLYLKKINNISLIHWIIGHFGDIRHIKSILKSGTSGRFQMAGNTKKNAVCFIISGAELRIKSSE